MHHILGTGTIHQFSIDEWTPSVYTVIDGGNHYPVAMRLGEAWGFDKPGDVHTHVCVKMRKGSDIALKEMNVSNAMISPCSGWISMHLVSCLLGPKAQQPATLAAY